MPTTVYREPTLHDLYHHILVDDKHKILFCYIPKVSDNFRAVGSNLVVGRLLLTELASGGGGREGGRRSQTLSTCFPTIAGD